MIYTEIMQIKHKCGIPSLSYSLPNIGFPIKICYPQTGETVYTTRCVGALPCYNATSALTEDTQISQDTANYPQLGWSLGQWHWHRWGTQIWLALSSILSAALFSDISLHQPFKLLCAVFNPIPAGHPLLTHPSQASVYDRGLRIASNQCYTDS